MVVFKGLWDWADFPRPWNFLGKTGKILGSNDVDHIDLVLGNSHLILRFDRLFSPLIITKK